MTVISGVVDPPLNKLLSGDIWFVTPKPPQRYTTIFVDPFPNKRLGKERVSQNRRRGTQRYLWTPRLYSLLSILLGIESQRLTSFFNMLWATQLN